MSRVAPLSRKISEKLPVERLPAFDLKICSSVWSDDGSKEFKEEREKNDVDASIFMEC